MGHCIALPLAMMVAQCQAMAMPLMWVARHRYLQQLPVIKVRNVCGTPPHDHIALQADDLLSLLAGISAKVCVLVRRLGK